MLSASFTKAVKNGVNDLTRLILILFLQFIVMSKDLLCRI